MKYIWNKSDDKFEHSEFIVKSDKDQAIAIAAGYTAISDEDYDKLVKRELCWEDGILVPYTKSETEITEEIGESKRLETISKINQLKVELAKIKEDIEQETFGLVRDDFADKKARAAEIINELRVLEGKEPREIKSE